MDSGSTGRQIVRFWMSCYDPAAWREGAAGKWACAGSPGTPDCSWAGPAYEQGAFCKRVLPRHRAGICIFEDRFLNFTGSDPPPHTFTVHFMADAKSRIPVYLAKRSVGGVQQQQQLGV
eukprot:tig00000492_g1426.t1